MPQRSLILRYLRRTLGDAAAGNVADAELLRRFVADRDQAAFELLLWRHAGMVLGVCHDVLRDAHAAEDAFQATFLALVKKAGAVRHGESLAGWLYQVAHRVALKARAQAARRGQREAGSELAALAAAAETGDEAARRELRPLLHEEVERLPDKYRQPVVLCYLEGLTHDEAARQLGWPRGTVAGRLARARDLLRKRLARRGVALSAAGCTAALAGGAVEAAPLLLQTTVRAGMLLAAGKAAAGVVSAQVLALCEGVLRTMFWHKLRATGALLAALVLLGGGMVLFAATGKPPEADPPGEDDLPPPRARLTREERREQAAAQAVSRNNLKAIALAMHNYSQVYGCLPPPAIYGKDGKPVLSWRVLLLPYLDENDLYKQFRLNEAWDSPHNKKLLAKMPKWYRSGGQRAGTTTYYQVFVGQGTAFEPQPGGPMGGSGGMGGAAPGMGLPGGGLVGMPPGGAGSGAPPGPGGGLVGGPPGGAGGAAPPGGSGPPMGGFAGGSGKMLPPGAGMGPGMPRPGQPRGVPFPAGIPDGTSNTILVIEAGTPVPWTKPEDIAYAPTGRVTPLGGPFRDVVYTAFADGPVLGLKKKPDETALRRAIERSDGQPFDRDDLIDPAPGITDPKDMKEANEELRQAIQKARGEVRALQQQLLEQRLASEGKKRDAAELEQLKREHQLLQQALEQAQTEAERLREQIELLKKGKRPVQKKG